MVRVGLRALEVKRWQDRYRGEWSATDGRHGGAERTAGENGNDHATLVLDLAKAFERVSLPVVWAWATHFNIPSSILRVLCGCFKHRPVQLEGCVAEPLQTAAILPGSQCSCSFALYCKMPGSEVMKLSPPVKLKVLGGDLKGIRPNAVLI